MLATMPAELKVTYLIVFAILLVLFFFVLFILVIYNKKQQVFIREKKILETETKNQKLEKELQIQKSLQSERDRISGDMHDELGAGISAIKLQSEILKQQIGKNALNNDDVDEIIRISEEMKISMREMLWSLNSRNDNLKKFAEHCKSYVENYFSKSTIHYSFETNITDENISVSSDIRRAILLVIKEACHNIIKHSNATEILLEFQNSEQNFCVTIKDNGHGFKLDSNTEGYGISTMKSRITSINGNIIFQSNEQGTKITISTTL